MKHFSKYLLMLGLASLCFWSCEEEKPEPVVVPVQYTLSGDTAFTNLEATVKVTADKATDEDVTVDIALDEASTFPARTLEFPANVKVAKGSTEASATVKLISVSALDPGVEYKAVFSASVGGVVLAQKVTMTYTRPDLNGKWSVIGDMNGDTEWTTDYEMKEAGNGWYTVEGIVGRNGNEFKFRRDGDWKVNFGGEGTEGKEFAVTQDGPNIKIAADGVYAMSLNPNAALAKFERTGAIPMTLAEIKALMPSERTEGTPFEAAVKDVVVTYVYANHIYLEDETAGMKLLLDTSVEHGLSAGLSLSGEVSGEVVNHHDLPMLSRITSNLADLTVTPDATVPLTELTIAELLKDFDKYLNMRVKLVGVTNEADLVHGSDNGDNNISQDGSVIDLYMGVGSFKETVVAGSTFDVIGFPTIFEGTKEIRVYQDSDLSNVVAPVVPVSKMTIADLKALKPETNKAKVDFHALVENVVVTYVNGSNVYLEDETGGILLYKSKSGLVAGVSLSGEVEGKIQNYNNLTEISDITSDLSLLTVTPGATVPETELTIEALLADFDKYENMRVKLTGVVNEAEISAKGDNNITQNGNVIDLYTNKDLQSPIAAGSTFDVVGFPTYYNATKELKIYEDAAISNVKVHVPGPALERQWGWYSTTDALWTTSLTAISITHPDGYGMARGLAMDDEYIYLPKSSAYPAVGAVKITDPSEQVKGNVTGVEVGDTFKSSFVRMMKNTDPAVNGGKDVLLLSNLTAASAANVVIYAYTSGITEAPVILAQFAWDSANNTTDWRRYGDRFFVTGTWQDGKIYLPSFNTPKTVVLSVANGARTAVTQIHAGESSPNGIKDLTVYPGSDNLFLTNTEIANLVAPTGGKANGWDEYALAGASANGKGTFGYNFFEFEGKKYIAYARISGNKAWAEVIEDKGDLLSSLEAQEGLIKSPIHSADNLDAEHATGNLADCCVRVINGVVYVASLSRDGGLVVDKLVIK